MGRFLITRTLKSSSPFKNWCEESNHTLYQQPFIVTESIAKSELPKTDWVFFSSPSGVQHFLKHYSLENVKTAALSIGTEKTLVDAGIKVGFSGRSGLSTREIGFSFKQVLKGQSVLFPIGDRSLKSVQQTLNPEQVHNTIVYSTTVKTHPIPREINAIIVTSPSNAEGLIASGVSGEQDFIAYGKATREYLEQNLIGANILTLSEFTEAAIIQQLEQLPQ